MKTALALGALVLLAASLPAAGAVTGFCADQTALGVQACLAAGGAGSGRCSTNGSASNGASVSAVAGDRDLFAGASHSCSGTHSGGTGYEARRVGVSLFSHSSSGPNLVYGAAWAWSSTQANGSTTSACAIQVQTANGVGSQPCPSEAAPPAPPILLP